MTFSKDQIMKKFMLIRNKDFADRIVSSDEVSRGLTKSKIHE